MNPIPNNKPFHSGNDERRNIEGRPKKLKTILAGYGLAPSQVNQLISELMMMNEIELMKLSEDDTASIFENIISKALLKSKKNGSLYSLETLLNRSYGMPKASNDITIEDKRIEITFDLI